MSGDWGRVARCPLCDLAIWSTEAWILHRMWHRDGEAPLLPDFTPAGSASADEEDSYDPRDDNSPGVW